MYDCLMNLIAKF